MKGEDQKVKNKEAKDKVTRLFKMCNQVWCHGSRKRSSKNVEGKEAMNVRDKIEMVHHESLKEKSWLTNSSTILFGLRNVLL
jgi:hypothetical protein